MNDKLSIIGTFRNHSHWTVYDVDNNEIETVVHTVKIESNNEPVVCSDCEDDKNLAEYNIFLFTDLYQEKVLIMRLCKKHSLNILEELGILYNVQN